MSIGAIKIIASFLIVWSIQQLLTIKLNIALTALTTDKEPTAETTFNLQNNYDMVNDLQRGLNKKWPGM